MRAVQHQLDVVAFFLDPVADVIDPVVEAWRRVAVHDVKEVFEIDKDLVEHLQDVLEHGHAALGQARPVHIVANRVGQPVNDVDRGLNSAK